jgi:hypothetical protein
VIGWTFCEENMIGSAFCGNSMIGSTFCEKPRFSTFCEENMINSTFWKKHDWQRILGTKNPD